MPQGTFIWGALLAAGFPLLFMLIAGIDINVFFITPVCGIAGFYFSTRAIVDNRKSAWRFAAMFVLLINLVLLFFAVILWAIKM